MASYGPGSYQRVGTSDLHEWRSDKAVSTRMVKLNNGRPVTRSETVETPTFSSVELAVMR